jgi:hypothetical protein
MFSSEQLYNLKSILIFTSAMVADAEDDADGYHEMKKACEELLEIVVKELRGKRGILYEVQ